MEAREAVTACRASVCSREGGEVDVEGGEAMVLVDFEVVAGDVEFAKCSGGRDV